MDSILETHAHVSRCPARTTPATGPQSPQAPFCGGGLPLPGARSGPHLHSCLPSSTSTKPSHLNHSPGKACLLLRASAPQTQQASSRINGACLGLLPAESDARHDSCFHRKVPTSLSPWLHPRPRSAHGSPTPPCSPASPPTSGPRTGKLLHDAAEQPGAGAASLPAAPHQPHTPGGRLRAPPSRDRCPAHRRQCRLPTPLPTSCQTPAPTSCLLSTPPHPPHPRFLPTALPVHPNVGLQPQPHRLAPTPPPIS